MTTFKVEINRGGDWETRGKGTTEHSREALIANLPCYARDGRAHRLWVDGVMVASVTGRGKLTRA